MSTEYDLKSIELPSLAGGRLRLLARLLESPLTRNLLLPRLLKDAGLDTLRALTLDEPPTFKPLTLVDNPAPVTETPTLDLSPVLDLKPQPPGFTFTTVSDYAAAYRAGSITPAEVAPKGLAAITDSDTEPTPLRAFIACNQEDVLTQAQAATERFRAGQPLSIFDGVPVAVKDEVDQLPYPTTAGTRFLGQTTANQDATVVARMRAAGALLIGKTNMHEIGIGITGLNPHHGVVRNPYQPGHLSGGSSSGSVAAVAAGFCPVAIGADGGGSIRIPAGLCGLVGLKPTYGRLSEYGAVQLDWSIAHLGPIGATVQDVTLAYALLAGPDPNDPTSCHQPLPTLDNINKLDLSDLTLGVYRPWFNHASASMVAGCEAMLETLQRLGAQTRDITIPELEAARIAHVVTISSEMATGLNRYYQCHRADYGLDVRINLALAHAFTARDYWRSRENPLGFSHGMKGQNLLPTCAQVGFSLEKPIDLAEAQDVYAWVSHLQAQRVRSRTMAHFRQALTEVDAILTPNTGITAPPIHEENLPDGVSDISMISDIIRFAAPSNFTGFPAIAFPAGYDEQGLPIAMQAIGRPWQEDILLRLAYAAEQNIERQAPQVHYQILPAKTK